MSEYRPPWREPWWIACLILALLCLGIAAVSYHHWNAERIDAAQKSVRMREAQRDDLTGPAGAGRPDKITIVIGEDGEVESVTCGELREECG